MCTVIFRTTRSPIYFGRKVDRDRKISVEYSADDSLTIISKRNSFTSNEGVGSKARENSDTKAVAGVKRLRVLEDQISDINVR